MQGVLCTLPLASPYVNIPYTTIVQCQSQEINTAPILAFYQISQAMHALGRELCSSIQLYCMCDFGNYYHNYINCSIITGFLHVMTS